jgi:hypothetical protein
VAKYSLELAFDSDDPEFCRGFEAADVYNAVRCFAEREDPADSGPPEEWTETVHATNAEMILRIAERFDLSVRSCEAGNGWLHVTFWREG